MSATRSIYITLFIAALIVPLIQTLFSPWKVELLHGVEANAQSSFPKFSVQAFLRGSFQQELENWLDRAIGFRGQLIRSDNQVNLLLFGEISSDYSSPLVLGHKNTLFERLYIDWMNNPCSVPDYAIRSHVEQLNKLNGLLEEKHIKLLILLSPSKTTFYRDRVPTSYIRKGAVNTCISDSDRLLAQLSAKGIPVIDGRYVTAQVARTTGAPAFARGGTHWSQFVACHIAKELYQVAQSNFTQLLPEINCTPFELKAQPAPLDRDLADLLNIWSPDPFLERLPYPDLPDTIPDTAPNDGRMRPRVVFVGGSFLWSVLVYFDFQRAYETREMFYYFKKRYWQKYNMFSNGHQ